MFADNKVNKAIPQTMPNEVRPKRSFCVRKLRPISANRPVNITTHNLNDIALDALFNVSENPFQGTHPLDFHVIQPDKALASDGGLEFVPNRMLTMFLKGELAAKTYFDTGTKIPIVV